MPTPINFDPNQFDPRFSAGGTLPVMPKPGGLVRVDSASFKATQDGTGQYLQLDVTVIDENKDWQGAAGAIRLNLQNASQEAMRIAHQQLSAICHVAGIQYVQTEESLIGAQFRVSTQLQSGDNPRGYTEPTGVYDVNGNEAQKGVFAQGQTGQQPAGQQPPAAPQQPPAQQPPAQQQYAPPAQPQQPPAVQQGGLPPAQAQPQYAPPAQPAQPAGQQPPAQPGPPSWAS